jgi:hypothetical protein
VRDEVTRAIVCAEGEDILTKTEVIESLEVFGLGGAHAMFTASGVPQPSA